MSKEREQKLIDLMFSIAMIMNDKEVRKNFDKMSNDELAAWVTKQLSNSGFETKPCGSCWGMLL